jgi:hypothetical protein
MSQYEFNILIPEALKWISQIWITFYFNPVYFHNIYSRQQHQKTEDGRMKIRESKNSRILEGIARNTLVI